MLSDHNHRTCGICRIISTDKHREKLVEFARIVNGEDRGTNVSPVLPTNRYKYGFGNRSVKAASSLSKRIVLNPERQKKARKLAALYRLVKGE